MTRGPARVAVFSEVNSKFGAPILAELVANQDVSVCALVTSPREAPLCSYYVGEPDPVDMTAEGSATASRYSVPRASMTRGSWRDLRGFDPTTC